MTQLDHLRQLKERILAIAKSHKAERVYVFGSCARGEETAASDVDFVAEFKPRASLFDVVGLEQDIADLLGRPVDVVTLDRLDKGDAFAANVRRDMVPL